MRQGWGDELSSRCSLVVNSSGSTLASTKPWISDWTLVATDSGCSLANRNKVDKKFLHLTLAVSGVICRIRYESNNNTIIIQISRHWLLIWCSKVKETIQHLSRIAGSRLIGSWRSSSRDYSRWGHRWRDCLEGGVGGHLQSVRGSGYLLINVGHSTAR